MTLTELSWTRFDTGCYRTTDGRWEARSMAYHTEGLSNERSWILFDRSDEDDGYCNHFASKRAAQEAAAELASL